MTRAEQIRDYNERNAGYYITGVKRMTAEQVDAYKSDAKSVDELYRNPSDAKRESWREIVETYAPSEVLGLSGSCHTYSVMLRASNGDLLHITRDNNYLIELKEADNA